MSEAVRAAIMVRVAMKNWVKAALKAAKAPAVMPGFSRQTAA